MADHLDEPPQKRVKMESFRQTSDQDALSNYDIFGLEDNLPDELVSTGNSGGWVDQLSGNKPPAQGPGPGQMNGEDPTGGVGVGPQVSAGNPGGLPSNVALRMQQQQFLMQQGNKNLVGNALNMGPLGSKSPNLQSPSGLQGGMSNMVGGMISSMSMSIANNGTQNMNMQGMNSIASQGGIGNVILTNSNLGPMGMQGTGGMVTSNLKQQLSGGNTLLGPGVQGNLIGAAGPQGNTMHHGGGLGGSHPGVQTIQNGPIMNVSVGNRMITQQHAIMRGPNPHLMPGGGAGSANVVGGSVGNAGPRMQNQNIPNIGNFSNTTKILSNQFTQSQSGNVNLGQITMGGAGGPNGPYGSAYAGGNPNQQQQGNVNVVNQSVAAALGGVQQQNMITIAQQRAVPPNILMQQQAAAAAAAAAQQQQLQQQQGNRSGGPIGSNIAAGGIVGNDGQNVIGGNPGNNPGGLANQGGLNAPQQSIAPTGVQQQRPQSLLGQQQQNPQQQQQSQQQQNPQQQQNQLQQQTGGPAGQSGQPGQQNPIQQQAASDKKKQIQQQLMLLLHAHKCTRRENENPNNPPDCKIPHCKTMKDVLAHMATCKANKDCSVAHCISSRQILVHWKSCQRPDCGICLPFRQGDKSRQPGPSGMQSHQQPNQPQHQQQPLHPQQQQLPQQQQPNQQNVAISGNVQQNQTGAGQVQQPNQLGGQIMGLNQQQNPTTSSATQINQQKLNQSDFEKQMVQQQQQQKANRFEQMQGAMPGSVSNTSLMSSNQGQPQMATGLVGNANVRMPNATTSGVQVLLNRQGQPNQLTSNILMPPDMPSGNPQQQQLVGQNIVSGHVVSLTNQQQGNLSAIPQQQTQLNTNNQGGVVPGGPGNNPAAQTGPGGQNIPMFNNANTTSSGPSSVGDGTTKPITGMQLQQQMNKLAQNPGGPGAPPQLPPGMPSVSTMPSGVTKDWHSSVTADLRNHLVHKLVQAIFPTSDPNTMMDKRMHNLVSYAEKVEKDMYEMANCRSEYYHLLAEKIYKIQKELEEKRQKRKEQQLLMQQQQQNLQPGGPGGTQGLPPGCNPNATIGQIRPNNANLIPGGMVSPLANVNVNVNNMQGVMRVPGPNPAGLVSQTQAQVAAAMRSHSPGSLPGPNMAVMQARMQFNPNQQNNANNANNAGMLVSQSGPSPNGLGGNMQNPVLSPFQNQGPLLTNAGPNNTGNMSAAGSPFINSNSGSVNTNANGPNVHTAANINQFNEIMLKSRQHQQQQQPHQHQHQQQQQPQSQQQSQQQQPTSQLSAQTLQSLPQAPSPFSNQQSSAGQINTPNSAPNTNAFVRNSNSNSNMPPTPTSVLDQLSSVSNSNSVGGNNAVVGITTATVMAGSNNQQQQPQQQQNSMVPVPSPSPSLSSNGPVQVGTPSGPPSVPSMIQSLTSTTAGMTTDHPTPTPPLMTSPVQNNSTTVTPSVTPTLQNSIGKGGNSNSSSAGGNSMPLPPSRPASASTNLSSQMAALEAATRDNDDTPPSPPDNQSGGVSQKGKLDSIKNEDDIKKEMDDDNDMDSSGAGAGKNANNDDSEIKQEIKSEPMDGDNSNSTVVKTEDKKDIVKIKDEPMSPNSTQEKPKPPVSEPTTTSTTEKQKKCVFDPEELRQALMPTLEKLIRQDPESMPFRTPVNPQALGIPDYFDIVKRPMDLGTIKDNLISGKYADPWEYVDDIWLMFDNAWLYNRKTSRVYRYCTKLSEIFEQEIDPVMQSLGYCCGRKYTFNPQVLCCYGKQLCTIPRDAKYYSYQNSLKAYGVVSDRYTFCQKCFNDIPGDTVTLGDDPMQSQTQIKKDQFKEMKNDHLELEPFVDCQECGRKQHQICVLYLESIWSGGFTCTNCMKMKGIKRKENKFSAKRLPTTKLGIYIETRVNNFLKKKEAGAGEVHIRVVSSSDKIVEVKPGMRRRFVENNELCGEFPYRAKALFAFEEVDGIDVCFFGMHVQEYGSECPAPNTRRVYIAYLDSVHFFRPRQYRTAVYHEILLGYMDYVKQLGFTMAHIWACPPSEGDDYIFHCHPPDQKIPKPKRLQEWYKKMLDKGMIERTIQDYKDILKQAMEDKLNSAAELPYFEGDFWPNVLEESIKELDQEEEEKRKQAEAAEAAANAAMFSVNEDNEASGDGKKKGSQKKAKKSNKSKANQRKNNKKASEQQNGNDLSAKIFATMEKHKEVFFVIRLHSVQSAASLAPIQDPDPLMNCDLMDGRDAFLTMARDKHFEFSSLRRAQFSTLNMLYELHNQGQDKFVYTCNNCKTPVETRYHCTVCDDFDLCMNCKEKVGHPHKMEKLGLDLDDGTSPGNDASKQANPQEARKQSIQRCIQSLVHACQCRDANCRLPSCQKMKRVVQHTKNCKRKTNGGCPICKQLIALCCYHAKHCQEAKCMVPFCPNIKHKLKQQQLQQRLQQAQLLRRRMAVMNTRTIAPTNQTVLPPGGVPTMQGTPVVGAPGSGGMSPQTVSSPVNPMSGMTSPHHPSMGMKPGMQTPSPNVLQVVKQVQEEAARQQVPSNGGFGKVVPTGPQMAPPNMQRQFSVGVVPNQPVQQQMGVQMGPGPTATGNNLLPMEQWGNRYPNNANQPGLRPPNQQMMQQGGMQNQNMMQMVNPGNSGQMNQLAMRPQGGQTVQPGMGGGGGGQQPNLALNTQQLSQIMQKIKNNPSNEGHNQILQMLKSNPQIMAAIIKSRQQSQNQAGNAGASGSGAGVPQGNPQGAQGPGGPMGGNSGGLGGPQQATHLQQMMTQQQQSQHPNQVVMNPNQVPHNRMPMQNPGMMQGAGGMQQGPPVQNAAWYKQQQMLRQMQITQSYPAPPYSQRPRAPQMGQMGPGGGPGGPGGMGPGQFQGGVNTGGGSFNPADQYAMQQGLKPSQTINVSGGVGVGVGGGGMGGPGGQLMSPGGVPLGAAGLGGGVGVGVGPVGNPLQAGQQNVMGPPHTMQQQLMQSPPPIRSPQPTPSPRSAPSPRAQPSASPRAQPSPHHLPSHSPAPQNVGGPNDMHNHMHPHQSPLGPGGPGGSSGGVPNDGGPGGVSGVGGPTGDAALTAQDQLTKFVEQL